LFFYWLLLLLWDLHIWGQVFGGFISHIFSVEIFALFRWD
jgi:hypothetical protein